MRVLQVTRQFFPSVGGIESVVHQLCRYLLQQGVECDVLTLNRVWTRMAEPLPRQEKIEGILVKRISFLGGRRFFLAPGVWSELRAYDVIHVHGLDFFSDFLTASGFLHRKPVLVSTYGGFFHTSWGWRVKTVYFHTITRLLLPRARRVVCTSQHDVNLFCGIVPLQKLILLGSGIREEFFSLPWRPEKGLMTYVGRLVGNKRVDRILVALAKVLPRFPEVRFVVVGEGEERKRLERLALDLAIADRVAFRGRLPDPALKESLSRTHLFVTASEYESFGVAVREAMAVGIPVVVNAIDTFQEFIVDGENGFLADFSDPDRAAETLIRVLRLSPDQIRKVSEAARETARGFSWQEVGRKYLRLYEEVLKEHMA